VRESRAMEGCGVVLTTTNRKRLHEAAGPDSEAFDVLGKPYDLDQLTIAIQAALERARSVKGSDPCPEFVDARVGQWLGTAPAASRKRSV